MRDFELVLDLYAVGALAGLDLAEQCRNRGLDYETVAERAAIIEYEGRWPRWMAEGVALLGEMGKNARKGI